MGEAKDSNTALIIGIAFLGLLALFGFMYVAGRDRGGVLNVSPNPSGGFTIIDQRKF